MKKHKTSAYIYPGLNKKSYEIADKVTSVVAEYYSTSYLNVKRTPTRQRKYLKPQQIAIYLLCNSGIKIINVALFFGKAHSTIGYSRDKVGSFIGRERDEYGQLIKSVVTDRNMLKEVVDIERLIESVVN